MDMPMLIFRSLRIPLSWVTSSMENPTWTYNNLLPQYHQYNGMSWKYYTYPSNRVWDNICTGTLDPVIPWERLWNHMTNRTASHGTGGGRCRWKQSYDRRSQILHMDGQWWIGHLSPISTHQHHSAVMMGKWNVLEILHISK